MEDRSDRKRTKGLVVDTLLLWFTHFIEVKQLRQAFISIVYFYQSSLNLMFRDKIFIN
ncbi:MAG: hypothetical protein MEEGG_01728 [Eggerthella lenta]